MRDKSRLDAEQINSKDIIDSEKHHKAIVRALPDIIFMFNANHIFVDVKANNEDILYKEPQNFIGKHIKDVMPAELAEMTISNIDKALQTGKLQVYQYMLEIGGRENYFEARMTVSGENETLAIVRDITNDKLRQKALQESEQLFNSLFATIPDIVLRSDLQGNLVFVNKNALEMGGYEKEDLDNSNMFSFIAPEDRDRALKNTILMMEKSLGPEEYQLLTKSGDRLPIEVNGDVLRDENGTPYGMVYVVRDLRERKKAEEESKKQKKLFEQVLTASSVSMALTKDRKIVWANNPMEELFGYSREEYKGKDISLVYKNKEDYDKIEELLYQNINTQKSIKNDMQFRKKDGTVFWGHYKINVLDANNPLSGVIISIIDITDRKYAEEKLKESREILSDIFNSVKEGIIHTDLNGKLLAANDAVYSLTGIPIDELIGKNSIILATKFLSVKNVTKIIPLINSIIKGKDIKPFVLDYKDKTFEVNSIYNKISKRITGTLRDITEQQRFEHQLILAKEKAEESDKLKTAFLQNLSHEVRTPLNGIIGFANLLMDNETDKEIVAESLKMIRLSSDRLISLIENVITLSELETGQIKTNIEIIAPYDIIADLERNYKMIAESKGLTFETTKHSDHFEYNIRTDRIAVNKILTLIMDNAIKFTTKGSINVGYDILDNKEICFFIKDTGIGIETKNLDRIFNKFEKLNVSDNWMTPGTGIGLTIAKGLTKHLNGRLEVESLINMGSSFKLYLALKK